jgi:hypothetical protein
MKNAYLLLEAKEYRNETSLEIPIAHELTFFGLAKKNDLGDKIILEGFKVEESYISMMHGHFAKKIEETMEGVEKEEQKLDLPFLTDNEKNLLRIYVIEGLINNSNYDTYEIPLEKIDGADEVSNETGEKLIQFIKRHKTN